VFFYLYLILDIFSRKIVGWEVHARALVHKSRSVASAKPGTGV
jgi:transposase InsO family protein